MLQPFVVEVASDISSGGAPTAAASFARTSSRSASARSKYARAAAAALEVEALLLGHRLGGRAGERPVRARVQVRVALEDRELRPGLLPASFDRHLHRRMVGQQPAVYAPPLVGPTVRRPGAARRGRAPGRSTRSASRSPTPASCGQRRRALADDVEVAGQHEHVARLGDAVGEDGRAQQLRVGDAASRAGRSRAGSRRSGPRCGRPGRRAAPWPTSRASAGERWSSREIRRRNASGLSTIESSPTARSSGCSRIAFAWPVSAERKRPWWIAVVSRPSATLRSSGRAAIAPKTCIPLQSREPLAATRPAAPAGRARPAGPRSRAGSSARG